MRGINGHVHRAANEASPWRLAVALAAIAHAGVLGLVSRAPHGERLLAHAPFAPAPMEIELIVGAGARIGEVSARAIEAGPRGVARGAPEAVRARGDRAPRTAAPGAAEPPHPGGPADAYDPLPDLSTALPGLGGVPAWSLRGVLPDAPRAPPAPTSVRQRPLDLDAGGRAIRSTLDARDQRLGLALPAANQAAQAIEATVMSSASPGESRATFEVDLDASGKVVGVRLARANGGDEVAWRRVVERVRAALTSRRLTMRGDAASLGAKVLVEVRTRERLPNGAFHGGIENIGAHKTRTVSSRTTVLVPGAKPLPEDFKPIVNQPFFTPPNPHESGVIPLTPAEEFKKQHPGD